MKKIWMVLLFLVPAAAVAAIEPPRRRTSEGYLYSPRSKEDAMLGGMIVGERPEIMRAALFLRAKPELIQTAREWLRHGWSLKKVLIMASIVYAEDPRPIDSTNQPNIAGILWKRLSEGKQLEVDVCGWTKENTGLPDRMIGEVSLEAIEAALQPADVGENRYFFHDDNGKLWMNKTFEEHEKQADKYCVARKHKRKDK